MTAHVPRYWSYRMHRSNPITATDIENASVDHLAISSDASLFLLGKRLFIQSKSTRDGGVAFNAHYFLLTASMVRAVAKQLDVTDDEALDLFTRGTLVRVWQEGTKLLDAELSLLRAGEGTLAVSGGATSEARTQFRKDLRFVVECCSKSLRRTKAARALVVA